MENIDTNEKYDIIDKNDKNDSKIAQFQGY